MVERYGSAFDSGLSLYKFDGEGYRLSACFVRHYANVVDARGRRHVTPRMKVTRVKCEPEDEG